MLAKIIVVAALASVAVAQDARQCTTTEAIAVAGIERTAAAACRTATNFRAAPPTGYPDDAQLTKMCQSTDCLTFFAGLKTSWTADCEFVFANSPKTNLLTIVKAFEPNCQRLVGGSTTAPPAPTTAAPPAATTTAPPATTAAPPAPTTTAPPAATTTAPPATTTAPPATTTAPPATTTPAPATTVPPTMTPAPPVAPHC